MITLSHTKCLASNNEKNCTVYAINTCFNEDGTPNEERFTLDDWKGLNQHRGIRKTPATFNSVQKQET